MEPKRGMLCWAWDANPSLPKKRPGVIVEQLAEDVFVIVVGYDSPHPPPTYLLELLSRDSKILGLTKPTHLKSVAVVPRAKIDCVCGGCSTKALIGADLVYRAKSTPEPVAPSPPTEPASPDVKKE